MMALAVATGIVACEKEVNEPQKPSDGEKIYTVSFNLGGEIDVTQNPLTRFTTDDRDLYGIEVSYEGGRYAYGLFDDLSNAKLDLSSAHKYEFRVLCIDDGKDKIKRDTLIFANDIYYIGYNSPFNGYNLLPNGKIENRITPVMNEFVVATNRHFYNLQSTPYHLSDNSLHYHAPNLDVYHGRLQNFTPTEENQNVQIHLKRMVYGLKIEIGDFFTEGVIVADLGDNERYEITPENPTIEKIFAYCHRDEWYNINDLSEACSDRDINFSWTKEDGSSVNWKTIRVRFNRLRQTVVKLDLYESQPNSGIDLRYEDIEFENDYTTYIHGDEETDFNWK